MAIPPIFQQEYLKLVSGDGYSFIIPKEVASISKVMKNLVENGENNGIIDLPEIRGEVLERVVQYLYYNRTYMGSLRQPPEFEVDPAMALDLLAAANYLEC